MRTETEPVTAEQIPPRSASTMRTETEPVTAEKSAAERRTVLGAVLGLPAKYRDVIYLHYYEGYTAPEIGQLLNKNPNTIYTLLNRGKKILKEKLGGETDA
ncbi:MAG TPA: sigma-70 family RNA polymerase sigma factor [Candidatus Scatomonas pullistercoris]|uniref:Sigma-70 family RNA polymerase sigma factor n=1 Tax=Candidatus Scatomonas pullistercoris TaxID=2840920 RepID=A0A9D1P1I9_9FIRM|nr:sigma-70 family RNA polymerase sigma factor [Candidatus Scatomonas pullistercoris]